MDSTLKAALIAAAISLVVSGLSGYVAVWSFQKQRWADLLLAAFNHMTGGSQERGAGLAILQAIANSIRSRPRWRGPGGWDSAYGSALQQHLYQQAIYVLRYGSRRYKWHEVQNIITIMSWLTSEQELFRRCNPAQSEQLRGALTAFVSGPESAEDRAVVDVMKPQIRAWRASLGAAGRVEDETAGGDGAPTTG